MKRTRLLAAAFDRRFSIDIPKFTEPAPVDPALEFAREVTSILNGGRWWQKNAPRTVSTRGELRCLDPGDPASRRDCTTAVRSSQHR